MPSSPPPPAMASAIQSPPSAAAAARAAFAAACSSSVRGTTPGGGGDRARKGRRWACEWAALCKGEREQEPLLRSNARVASAHAIKRTQVVPRPSAPTPRPRALRLIGDHKLGALAAALGVARPQRKVVQHNGRRDRDVERRGAGAVLRDVHKRVAQPHLLLAEPLALRRRWCLKRRCLSGA